MPSTPSSILRLELMGNGDQPGSWGTTTNTNLGTLLEAAIAGWVSVSCSANQVLSIANYAPDESRRAMLSLSTGTGANFNVFAPPVSKSYVIYNTSAFTATIYNSTVAGNTTAAGTGVTIPAGKTMTVWSNGTNFRVQNDNIIGDLNGNLTSASPTAPTQSPGTNNTTVATTAFVQAAVQTALQTLHPVGSIYINATNATNPGTLLGFGTWVAFGAGRVPVGFNAADPLFDTAEETGGSANAIVVSHNHTLSGSAVVSTASLTGSFYAGKPNNSTGIVTTTSATIAGSGSGSQASGNDYAIDASHTHTLSGTTDTTGSSGTNANYQPYITVYMWKRTA